MNDVTVKGGEGEVTIGRKEKSVLQGKLTKLAIQIGYGGTPYTLIVYRVFLFLGCL